MKKMLVLYYSWSCGNTERIARELADACGADLERIETKEAYPDDYDETVEIGKREVDQGMTRKIRDLAHDVSDYDMVAIGTPTWWYTMAPAVLELFRTIDFSGKLLIPFATNGGWPGSALDDMQAAAPEATTIEPYAVRFDSQGGSHMVSKQTDVTAWVTRVARLMQ